MWLTKCVCIFVAICSATEASRILGFFTAPSPSHLVIHRAVMKGLFDKGHNITVVSTYPVNIAKNSPNYREIYLDNMDEYDPMQQLVEKAVASNDTKKAPTKQSQSWGLPGTSFLSKLAERSAMAVKHAKLQALMNDPSEKFDLFVYGWVASDFHLGIAGHFRCPSVAISTLSPMKNLRDLVGNPASVSTVPMMTTGLEPGTGPMGFFLRMKTFLTYVAEHLLMTWLDHYHATPRYNELFPAEKGYPTFEEVKQNVSLVLVNHHFSMGGIRPMMPNFIEISGVQTKTKPDPLPAHLQTFLDEAKHGAIFLSFGSNIKSKDIDDSKIETLLRTFAKLKQRVIWKWDVPIDNVPKNVIVSDWVPQTDVLAHPNMKLFISHCGLGSVNEAKFYGVPILAMPFFTDQPINARAIVQEGWATLFHYGNITEPAMTAAIAEMLDNPVYRNKVQRMSQLYRDRPVAPLDLAVYWIEYVLRYDGAKHMQNPGVFMNFFQLHSLDVMFCLLVVCYVIYKTIVFGTKKMLRYAIDKTRKIKTA